MIWILMTTTTLVLKINSASLNINKNNYESHKKAKRNILKHVILSRRRATQYKTI